jgi:phosphonate transport system substrate-binding protein
MKHFNQIILLVFLLACTKQGVLGSKERPIKLYISPYSDTSLLKTGSQFFSEYLTKETGLYFDIQVPLSNIAVVEAFGTSKTDIALVNALGYIIAKEKYQAKAMLRAVSEGQDHYYGMWFVRADSGIKSVEDLKGKKVAYVDATSTSGYFYPLKVLKDKNIVPSNVVFAGKHDSVITMVYQKQVDAGAAFYSDLGHGKLTDARSRVLTQFPDVATIVKPLQISDPIPQAPIVFRKDLDPEISKKFIQALKKLLSTPEGQKIFKDLYAVENVVDSDDSYYDQFAATLKELGIQKEELIKKD